MNKLLTYILLALAFTAQIALADAPVIWSGTTAEWLPPGLRAAGMCLNDANGVMTVLAPGTSGNVPVSNGSTWVSQAAPAPDLSDYFLLTGRAGGQVANGGTAPGDELRLSSTTDSTKGDIIVGQSYRELADGSVAVGTGAGSASSTSGGIHFKTDTIVYESPSGAFDAAHPFYTRNFGTRMITYADGTGTGDPLSVVTNQARTTFGADGRDYFKVNINMSSTNTTQATPNGNDPILSLYNRDATVGNFTGLIFNNSSDVSVGSILGINEDHGGGGAATGSLAFRTRNAGTLGRALSIASDKTITMDKYGAGIAHFDSTGLISSSAVDLSGADATGTLAAARMPALTGDVTTSAGSVATTVAKIQTTTVTGTTGTGKVVFDTAPTISNPVVGTQSPGDNSTKAASTAYVDLAVRTGGPAKDASNYATTAALPTVVYSNGASGVGATLTASALAAISIDGATPTVGQRILVKNQVSTFQNGIYTVTVVGSVGAAFVLTRATDYDQAAEAQAGSNTFVISGTANGSTVWDQNSADVATMGTDAITFAQTGGASSGGGTLATPSTKTSGYTLTNSDDVIVMNCSTPCTLTAHAVSGATVKPYRVLNKGSAEVTVARSGSDTFNADTSITLGVDQVNWPSFTMIPDGGTTWLVTN